MTDPVFRARTAPILPPEAQALVNAYEATYGASAPGCCPAALAAAFRALVEARLPEVDPDEFVGPHNAYYGRLRERERLRREFLAVADELNGEP